MDNLSLTVSFIGLILVSFLLERGIRSLKNGHRPPLPPGPKGLPFVGNLNDLPKPGELEAHHWLKHLERYGPISSITVMGQTIVIINDAQMAFELLDKRSLKHSSRPKQVFAGEMVGWENATGMVPYGERFRVHRKNLSRIIGSKATAAQYNTLQEAEVGHFLLHLLDDPKNLVEHIKREAGSLILKIAYGYTAEPTKKDPFLDIIQDAMDNFAKGGVPGAFLVDIFPFLRFVPDWVPGAGFKTLAKQWRSQLRETTDRPYAFVEHQLAQGKDNSSFLSRLIESGDSTPEEQFTSKFSALGLYAGGADTTVSSIATFFLAMTLFPEIQEKAQKEIDEVVGQDRLPGPSDRENLPYTEAILKEVMRWHPIGPMGLPHGSDEDDVFEGYFIPKEAMLLPNIWHFTHNPEVYHEPMSFNPERFLASEGHEPEADPQKYVFGFGRRICPGRVLAETSLFLNIAQSLAALSITKPILDGKVIEPTAKFTPGVISHPEPFDTSIKPRSLHHEKLIRSIEKIHPWEESDSKILKSIKF